MALHTVPPGVPHFIVEMWCASDRSLDTTLLASTDVFREGQAADRFKLACQRQTACLSKDNISQDKLLDAPTMNQVEAKVALLQSQARDAETQREAQQGSSSLFLVSGSSLEDPS
eukprot:2678780-Lingulodinium_polyedra.AAC.1